MTQLTRKELEEVILAVGFPEITSTIRKQILTGVQKYNLTYLEIGYIIQYSYTIISKPLVVSPVYGIGLAYNLRNQALAYAKEMREKSLRQREFLELAEKKKQDVDKVVRVISKVRQYQPKKIDINKL